MENDTRMCVGCNDELSGRSRKWCSDACRVRHYRKTNSDYVKSERKKNRDRERERRVNSLAANPLPSCSRCGVKLEKRGAQYCTKPACQYAARLARKLTSPLCKNNDCDLPSESMGKCHKHYVALWRIENMDKVVEYRHRRRANYLAAYVEPVSRSEILERDEYICGICGEQIDPDVKYPDAQSASLDHVVPLARGGQHSKANCQAAHYGCNAAKGDRLEFEVTERESLSIR